MENGYAICFNEWALDKDINGELGLLIIISSLSAEKGYCFASNSYLANLFDIREETISRKLKKLEDKGYITIEYDKKGCEVKNRYIRLTKLSIHDCVFGQSTIDEIVKDNNTILNNTKLNKKEIYKERFIKPTLEEVEQYCLERNNGIDAQTFIDFYQSKDWMIGKSKMKDWKACVRTWEKRKNTKAVVVDTIPDWFDKEQDIKTLSNNELEEMESILNEIS